MLQVVFRMHEFAASSKTATFRVKLLSPRKLQQLVVLLARSVKSDD